MNFIHILEVFVKIIIIGGGIGVFFGAIWLGFILLEIMLMAAIAIFTAISVLILEIWKKLHDY